MELHQQSVCHFSGSASGGFFHKKIARAILLQRNDYNRLKPYCGSKSSKTH